MQNTDKAFPKIEQPIPTPPENIPDVSQFNIYKLKRNSKCPCGSGKKVKVCHPSILNIRHKAIQDKLNMQTQFSAHNRLLQEHGHPKMTEQQWKLYLEEKRIEEELKKQESQNV